LERGEAVMTAPFNLKKMATSSPVKKCKFIKTKAETSQAGVFDVTLRCQVDRLGAGGPTIEKEKWLVDTINDKKFLVIVRGKNIWHFQYDDSK
jgi:hypothetical protein